MTTMDMESYIKTINEDLEWLNRQPQSLERDHIESVLKGSIRMYYTSKEEELEKLKAERARAEAEQVQSMFFFGLH